jgi:hypothetical protein
MSLTFDTTDKPEEFPPPHWCRDRQSENSQSNRRKSCHHPFHRSPSLNFQCLKNAPGNSDTILKLSHCEIQLGPPGVKQAGASRQVLAMFPRKVAWSMISARTRSAFVARQKTGAHLSGSCSGLKVSNSDQTSAAPCAFLPPAKEAASMIIAHDKWTELLTCPRCGMSGPAHLSRPAKRTYDFNVEAVPAGFKVVRVAFGEAFYCEACNRPADTQWPVTARN